MHDIKFIRDNPEQFDNSLQKRGFDAFSKRILELHNRYLDYLNKKQKLQEKKNSLSKSFSNNKDDKKTHPKQSQRNQS